ncbi:MAG: cytidine deaminase [Candidatus Delongbacteria bacterium]|nr:cytidine deaminase [Candidatus Delongbacteria bacterium]MBN2836293.1 cytidine deaminase [Candidatus Delongbacteria bacterium]
MEIFEELEALLKKTKAIYSGFAVSSILITSENKKYSGVNIESSSYGLSVCAERTALFKALSDGEYRFKEIHILSSSENIIRPCGACRQLLVDYASEIDVFMYCSSGKFEKMKIEELLPFSFKL